MKFDTKEHKKNPLMKREEYVISVDHSGAATPSRNQLAEGLAKLLKVQKDTILIDKIFTKSGKSESDLKVFVYRKKGEIPRYKIEKFEKRVAKKKAKKEAEPAPAPAQPKSPSEAPAAEKQPEEEPAAEETNEEQPTEEPVAEEKPAKEEASEEPAEKKEKGE
jgi:ribosomal protein S24E